MNDILLVFLNASFIRPLRIFIRESEKQRDLG